MYSKLIYVVEFLFALYMSIKYATIAALQIYYEYRKGDQKLDSQMDAIQGFLRNMGATNRQLGALGVHFNILFSAVPLCFYFPVIFRKMNFRRFIHPTRLGESLKALASVHQVQPTSSIVVEPKGDCYILKRCSRKSPAL